MMLSILIPCKNEAESIVACVLRVVSVYPAAQVLVIDSGLDDTALRVRQLKIDHPHLVNVTYLLSVPDRGKGDAIKQGIAHANGDIIAEIDADLQFFPEDLPRLIDPILSGEADMTLGSRFMRGSMRGEGSSPFFRFFGNLIVSGFFSCVFRTCVTDALAGMKAWRKTMTEHTPLTSYTYSYEAELIAIAIKSAFRVKDIPVRFISRVHGASTVSVVRAGCVILRDIVLFRWKK